MTNHLAALTAALALFAGTCPAADAPPPPRFSQAPAGNALTFTFEQAGAQSSGTFRQFTTVLVYDEKNLAGSSLNVRVEIASVDTQDQERDGLLKDADLFNAAKYPAATYTATSLARRADGGIEAVGKLTIRDISRDLRLPLKLQPTAAGLDLRGEAVFKRLDYGVGQGEWKSTDAVGDEVKIQYKVSLVRTPAPL
jgi:polyisoprenoid-binding protein YceI